MNLAKLDSIAVHESPFDGIRQVDEFGAEHWSARELMPLLGYKTWQKFSEALDRSKSACENCGNPVTEHFLPEAVKSSGRPQENYILSRFGAYLTAMNGDSRKPEIAAAQAYFAAKTREAETVIPVQAETIEAWRKSETLSVESLFSVANCLKTYLLDSKVDEPIAAMIGLGVVAIARKELAPAIEEGKRAIAALAPSQEQWYTPTELGEQVGMSARNVNAALEELGLQVRVRNDKGKAKWELTKQGAEYGNVFMATSARNDWSGGQIRWKGTVLGLLEVEVAG